MSNREIETGAPRTNWLAGVLVRHHRVARLAWVALLLIVAACNNGDGGGGGGGGDDGGLY
ncbi:MAG: hypothetical protein ACRDHD_13065 [Candidatus Limnocylindria bacterium]